MTFSVEGEDGEVLARGDDLEALRVALRPRQRAELAAATALDRALRPARLAGRRAAARIELPGRAA